MTAEDMIQEVFRRAVAYDHGDPLRIQHFTKVHNFSRQMAIAEGMGEEERKILELAAILHDIGIHEAERRYNNGHGKYQEIVGPEVARELLKGLPVTEAETERICYLIGHHHTYTNIQGLDYRILVEADFLVNLFEDGESKEAMQTVYRKMFVTESGRELCRQMFDLEG